MSKSVKSPTTRALVVVVAAALALPAIAQDASLTAAPVQIAHSSSDWTGAHVGLQFGYGETDGGLSGDSTFGGVAAGYDWDLGNWVVGVGADINFTGIDTKAGDIDSLARLKVRGGYDFGGTMLYATTGASYAVSDDLGDKWGYFGGVGLEHRVSDTISIVGEVATHRFDSYHNGRSVNANTALIGINYRF